MIFVGIHYQTQIISIKYLDIYLLDVNNTENSIYVKKQQFFYNTCLHRMNVNLLLI